MTQSNQGALDSGSALVLKAVNLDADGEDGARRHSLIWFHFGSAFSVNIVLADQAVTSTTLEMPRFFLFWFWLSNYWYYSMLSGNFPKVRQR